MKIETPVSDTIAATAPADGMARFMASRDAKDTTSTTLIAPVAVEDPEPLPDDKPKPSDPPKPAAAKPAAADAVLDPETGDAIENPTRNDRRIAKLWKREQEAIAENRRLLAIIEQRNAAPLPDTTVQTAGRPDAQALSSDQQLTLAAKARVRKEPDEAEIGKTYPTYEAFVKDCAIYGGELAVAKAAIQTETNQRNQAAAAALSEQKAKYPDWDARMADSQNLRVGTAVMDVIQQNPTLNGDLKYWVMTHHADVARISALPYGTALVEMGKVMAGLNVPSADDAGGTSRRTSRAPAPTRDIGRPAGHVSDRVEDANNYSEFETRRNAQIASSRRR